MKGKSFFKFFVILQLVFIFAFSGCVSSSVDNNHLKFVDLANHFARCGIKVEDIKPLRADVVHSQSGATFKIKGRNIGVYKYNILKTKQKAKIDKIKEDGFIYLCGLKYPAKVKGSFIMIDYNQNPDSKKIIEAFENFDDYEER
jgi:hypothetical protein